MELEIFYGGFKGGVSFFGKYLLFV